MSTECRYERGHRTRANWDTTAGITVNYGDGMYFPRFYVHCLSCHADFGPFRALAQAQAQPRHCPDCRGLLRNVFAKES